MVGEFRQIIPREELLKNKINGGLKLITPPSDYRHLIKDWVLSGSLHQGTFTASMFKVNERYKNSIDKDVDIDLESIIDYKFDSPEKCLHDIEDKPGNVRVFKECMPDRLKALIEPSNIDFIKHYTIRQEILKLSDKETLNTELPKLTGVARHYFNGRKMAGKVDVKYINGISKATIKRIFEIYMNEDIYFSASFDIAVIFKFDFSPVVLQRFLERTRYNLTEEISSYIYVIAKTSHEEKHNINTTEWTYSFAHMENYILTSLNDAQRLVYVIFKSIFSRSLKPLDEDRISSYVAKTIIFWKFEKVSLVDDDCHNDTRIWENVEIMFKDMLCSFQKGFLPNYFIPEMNVIENYNESLVERCVLEIQNVILPDLKTIIQIEDVRKAGSFIEELLTMTDDLVQLYHDYILSYIT